MTQKPETNSPAMNMKRWRMIHKLMADFCIPSDVAERFADNIILMAEKKDILLTRRHKKI